MTGIYDADAELYRAWLAGNGVALESLVARHSDALVRFAYSYTGDEAAADTVAARTAQPRGHGRRTASAAAARATRAATLPQARQTKPIILSLYPPVGAPFAPTGSFCARQALAAFAPSPPAPPCGFC